MKLGKCIERKRIRIKGIEIKGVLVRKDKKTIKRLTEEIERYIEIVASWETVKWTYRVEFEENV